MVYSTISQRNGLLRFFQCTKSEGTRVCVHKNAEKYTFWKMAKISPVRYLLNKSVKSFHMWKLLKLKSSNHLSTFKWKRGYIGKEHPKDKKSYHL